MSRNTRVNWWGLALVVAAIAFILGTCMLAASADDAPQLVKTPESIRAEQVRNLVKCGYPTILKMTVDDFTKMIPLPESTDAPVLVISPSFVPIATQCQLLGITDLVDVEIYDIDKVPDAKVYWRYGADDGDYSRGMGMNVAWCRQWLQHDGRVLASVAEILAIHRENPKKTLGVGIDAPGSTCKHGLNPYLWYNSDKQRLELQTGLSDQDKDSWGSASFTK